MSMPKRENPECSACGKKAHYAHGLCNACYAKARRRANPEAQRLANKRWDEQNPRRRLAVKLRQHGLTLGQYDKMLEDQGGACLICYETPTRRLDVDHDHRCCPGPYSCGRCVRGLLCNACNTGIGKLGDDPDRLLSAAAYLMTTEVVFSGQDR